MMKKNLFYKLCVLLFIINIVGLKNAHGQIGLHFDEFDIDYKPQKCNDTITLSSLKKYKGCVLKIFLSDCRGQCYFELVDGKGNLKITGNYANAVDTLVKYRFVKIIGRGSKKEWYRVIPIKYLYPLQKGEWIYYNEKGEKYKSLVYDFIYGI